MLQSGRFAIVVSSDVDVRDMYVEMLHAYRTPAVGVSNCDELLALIREGCVDVVLYDVVAPGDFDECGRAAAMIPPSRIVVLTAWVSEDRRFRDHVEGLGCAAFIAKPCSPELVVATLHRVRSGERGIEIVSPGGSPV